MTVDYIHSSNVLHSLTHKNSSVKIQQMRNLSRRYELENIDASVKTLMQA